MTSMVFQEIVKEIFSEIWPRDLMYASINSVTHSYKESDKGFSKKIKPSIEKYSIIIYPTSIKEHLIPNTPENFKYFLNSAFELSNNNDHTLFYKSKLHQKKLRGDNIEDIDFKVENEIVNNALSKFKNKIEFLGPEISVYDTFSFLNMGICYSNTTVAFELIENRIKVIVFVLMINQSIHFTNIHPF